MSRYGFFSILILIWIICISGCTIQSDNLEISDVKLTPGDEILGGFDKIPTGSYYSSTLSFVITNRGSVTDRGHYSISARVYDRNGNFVAKPIGGFGSSLEPGESKKITLVFSNMDPRENLNFSTIDIGKIDIIFHHFTDEGKSDYDKTHTITY